MSNEFASTQDSVVQSARNATAVTPHAINPLANVSKALYVGGFGSVVCRLVDDSTDVTFAAVPAGSILPIRVTHVRDTGTATSIVNLY